MSIDWRSLVPGRCVAFVVSAMTAATLVGCGDGSDYQLAPVHGKLMMGSRPLAGAKVMFAPVAKEGNKGGKAAVGLTGEDGTFTLTTYDDGDGAVVGDHWVTVFAPKVEQPRAAAPGDPVSTDLSFKRLSVNQKKSVSADQDNVIDITL
jgi:hypothetical protein